MKRTAVVLGLLPFLLFGGVGLAQSWPSGDAWMDGWKTDFHDPTTNAWRKTFGTQATRTAAQQYSTGSSSVLSQTITMGRKFVRSPVAKLGGAALITAALFWFYEEAQKSTGTGLDNWQTMDPVGTSIIEAWAALDFCNTSYCDWNGSYRKRAWTGSEWTDSSVSGSANVILPAGCNTVACAVPHIEAWAQGQANESQYQQGNWKDCWNGSGSDCTWVSNTYYDPQYNRVARQKTVDARPILIDFLDTDPAAETALENQVIKDYLQDAMTDNGNAPYTYQHPFGPGAGIELDPAPENVNVWHDNPYANPDLDTDGDGYKDSSEATAGTDPDDASSTPTVDPHDPNAPDADGDGVPDQYDPCPFDATNSCADAEDGDCGELACESTLNQAVTELGEIKDALTADTSTINANFGPASEFADPELGPLELWQPDLAPARAAFEASITDIASHLDGVSAAAEGKFPFGMSDLVTPPPTTIAAECISIDVAILEAAGSYDMCTNPLDGFLTGTVRPILSVLLTFGFLWTVMAWVREA